MTHAKFRGNRLTGSGEEDFGRGFTIYRRDGHLGHETKISTHDQDIDMTKISRTEFECHYQKRFHIKFQFDRPSRF